MSTEKIPPQAGLGQILPAGFARAAQAAVDALFGVTEELEPWDYPKALLPTRRKITKEEREREDREEADLEDEDPGGPDVKYYRLRRQLAANRGRILAFAQALGEYADFQAELEDCGASLGAVHAEWTARVEAAQLRSRQAGHAERRVFNREYSRAFGEVTNGFWQRYKGIWKQAHNDLDLPLALTATAIKEAIRGTWRNALIEWDQAPETVHFYVLPSITPELLAPLGLPWDIPEKALGQIVKVLEKTRPDPGRRRPGGNETDYDVHIAVAQAYRTWHRGSPAGTDDAFAKAVLSGIDYDGNTTGSIPAADALRLNRVWPALYVNGPYSVQERTVTKKRTAARWLLPCSDALSSTAVDPTMMEVRSMT